MDFMEVSDFIDRRCISEINHEIIIDHLKNPLYVNKLKQGLRSGSDNVWPPARPSHGIKASPNTQLLQNP